MTPLDKMLAYCDAMPFAVTLAEVSDPDLRLTYVNHSFTKLTGYEPEDVLGRNCRFLQGPETDPADIERLRQIIRTHHARAVQILNYRKDGTPFWNLVYMEQVELQGHVPQIAGVQSEFALLPRELSKTDFAKLSPEAQERLLQVRARTMHYRREAFQMQAQAGLSMIRLAARRA